ncbi:MAG: DMT family transporter [Firmicutes bacterium]|nr:DMT family transporter [Bacillota bacterium]
MSTSSQRPKALLLLILTAVLWSSGGLLIKLVPWHPLAIAGMRSAIAALFFLALLRRPKFDWSSAQVGAAAAYAAMVILFVSATKLTTAANAVLLQYTAPIYVALFSGWLLGEKISRLDWTVLVLVMGGMVLFFLDELSLAGWLGNILAVLSGMATATLVLFLRKQKDGSTTESVLLGNALTALLGLPFCFLGGPAPGLAGWLALLFLGVFQLGLSYAFYTWSIKHVTALEAILVPIIEPVLNPVWVFVSLGERPGPWALIGGAVVVITVTLRCVLSEGRARTAVTSECRSAPRLG